VRTDPLSSTGRTGPASIRTGLLSSSKTANPVLFTGSAGVSSFAGHACPPLGNRGQDRIVLRSMTANPVLFTGSTRVSIGSLLRPGQDCPHRLHDCQSCPLHWECRNVFETCLSSMGSPRQDRIVLSMCDCQSCPLYWEHDRTCLCSMDAAGLSSRTSAPVP